MGLLKVKLGRKESMDTMAPVASIFTVFTQSRAQSKMNSRPS